MKTGWGIVFGILCGLLGAGIILVASARPRGQPVKLIPPPTAAPIIVHVSGAVSQPGVYTLPRESRVQAALEAAGGILPEANVNAINLAAFIKDGTQLWVPFQTSGPPQFTPRSNTSPVPENEDMEPVYQTQDGLININTATQNELEALPGIGPVMAQRIITYREENGPFAHIEDIEKVPGIGPVRFEQMRALITVDGYP